MWMLHGVRHADHFISQLQIGVVPIGTMLRKVHTMASIRLQGHQSAQNVGVYADCSSRGVLLSTGIGEEHFIYQGMVDRGDVPTPGEANPTNFRHRPPWV